jgi:putative phosphoribosyl transferase
MIFEKLRKNFILKFTDRYSAGTLLAEGLLRHFPRGQQKNILVLGIPRGGVVIADAIVKKLKTTNFDIILPRRLLIPHNKENGFGAIMEDGSTFLDDELVKALSISEDYIEKEKLKQIDEIKRKQGIYRNGFNLPNLIGNDDLSNLTVILADDGAATGSTLIASARWIRNRNVGSLKELIIAVPVAPKGTVDKLKKECDHLQVIMAPQTFNSVSEFYVSYGALSDQDVINILSLSKKKE